MALNQPKITLGICAMEKKVKSKHMQQILENLKSFGEFELVDYPESLIFNESIEKWPVCQSMIVFFSNGFPYNKVLEFIKLRKPFLINDFETQKIFWDRRKISKILKENNIPTPNGFILDREEEINNDSQTKIKLNTTPEIKQMIKEYNEKYCNNKDFLNFNLNNDNNNNTNKNNDEDENENKQILKETLTFDSSNSYSSEDINKEDLYLNEIKEYDDYIIFNGKKLKKPFVEKPANGDDHNIYIYYPMSHGGGQKRLFRKTDNFSSLYYPNENHIRRDHHNSFLYEEYLQTDGIDIKVYTVGPYYFHAEARKSPSLDGRVQRSIEGKEERYPVNLTNEEKEIAIKIVYIFKQNVCGFDILRSEGKSFVCDVNGWSFVKGNKKYYQDCAIILRKIILTKINRKLLTRKSLKLSSARIFKDMNIQIINKKNNNINGEELRSIVAVFRHADRSPKQKLKLVVQSEDFLHLFDIFDNGKKKDQNKPNEIKLTNSEELLEIIKIVNNILDKNGIKEDQLLDDNINPFFIKLYQIKLVLEKNINIEDSTRKIQLRPIKYTLISTNPIKFKITQALFIMKWGGTITHAGITQAKLLGTTFRSQLYPHGNNEGDDLIRLHNSYRHDFKCYSSEEDRCLKTAASFLQGLLQLEGNLIPIITSMVRKDENINKFLDVSSNEIENFRKSVKSNINDFCNYDGNLKEKYNNFIYKYNKKTFDNYNNENLYNNISKPINNLIDEIENFYVEMKKIHTLLKMFINHLKSKLTDQELLNECDTYFILNKNSIKNRNNSSNNNIKISKDLDKEKIIIKPKKKISAIGLDKLKKNDKNPSNKNSTFNLNTTPKLSKKKMHSINNNEKMDCEEEKVILIFKRYIKLYQDFYKDKKFEISKIPDIYDNIKYDILHNKSLLNDIGYELYNKISKLAYFVMPLEYGITINEKVEIGFKFIKDLINKIARDLLWWDLDNVKVDNTDSTKLKLNEKDSRKYSISKNIDFIEKSYSGLDQKKIDSNEMKSSWRRVKTRFYFTCASHIYSLLNIIKFGLNSFLIHNDKKGNDVWKNFDLDYCSHIVFRLFENFNVGIDDNKRFRIEILMSPGANADPTTADENHMVPVAPWIILNDHLTLDDIKKYFNELNINYNMETKW